MSHRTPVIVMAWPKPDYEAAVSAAGGQVRVLSPDHALPAALEQADGVVLTGGVDLDPIRYGQTSRHETVEVDALRDQYELALAALALTQDLPILAICRGAQVLNVAAGGTLIQDIPSARSDALAHTIDQPKTALAHHVTVDPASTMASLLREQLDPRGQMRVNSRHHQAVDVVAPGFTVAAVAPDGIIEAIERPGSCFCVGVQWHPENFWRSGEFSGLFAGLVRAAAARSAASR